MFDLPFVGVGAESRRPWTFTVSLLSQGLLLAVAGIASLVASPELPFQQWTAVLLEPPRPPAAAPPPAAQPVVQVQKPEVFRSEMVQPASIPDKAAIVVDAPKPTAVSSTGSVVGATGPGAGDPDGVIGAMVRETPVVAPPPPPKPKEPDPAPAQQSVQVGGDVQAAKLIRRVAPVYPPIAVQARAQGVVKLRAVIAEDGSIEQLQTLSGNPLLIRAAIHAVQQWRYRPTLLNGKAVQVVTQVDVHFKLQ